MFTVHNWWHLALYLLEAGRIDDALALYDARVHNSESAGVPIEMLDASALLWRLFLDGDDTGERFGPLADAWATRSGDVPWYAFNDLHAVMAFVGAGRFDDASVVIERLDRYVAAGGGPEVTNVAMTAEIGLPASRRGRRNRSGRLRSRDRAPPADSQGVPALRRIARPARRVAAHLAHRRDQVGRPRPCRLPW